MSVAPSKKANPFLDPIKLIKMQREAQQKLSNFKNNSVSAASTLNDKNKVNPKSKTILDEFGSWINETAKNVGKTITVGLDDIENFGETLFKDFSSFLGDQVDDINNSIDGIAGAVGITIDQVGENIFNAVEDAKSFLDSSLEDIGSSVSAFPSLVKETLENSVNEIGSHLNSVGAGIVSSVTEGIADSQKFVGSAITRAIDSTNELAGSIADNFDKTIDSLESSIDNTLDSLSDAFNDSLLAVTMGFSAINKTLLEVFTFDADKLIKSMVELRAKAEELAKTWSVPK